MIKWQCEHCLSKYRFEADEVPDAPFRCTRTMSPNDMSAGTQICAGTVYPLDSPLITNPSADAAGEQK